MVDVFTFDGLKKLWPSGANALAGNEGQIKAELDKGGFFKISDDGAVTLMMSDGLHANPAMDKLGKLNAAELKGATENHSLAHEPHEMAARINSKLRQAGAAVPTDEHRITEMLKHFQEAAHVPATGQPDEATARSADMYLESYRAKLLELYKDLVKPENQPTFDDAAAFFKQGEAGKDKIKEARKHAIDEVKTFNTSGASAPHKDPANVQPQPKDSAMMPANPGMLVEPNGPGAHPEYHTQFNKDGSLVAPGGTSDIPPSTLPPAAAAHAAKHDAAPAAASHDALLEKLETIIQKAGKGNDTVPLSVEDAHIITDLMGKNGLMHSSPLEARRLGGANTASSQVFSDIQEQVRAKIEKQSGGKLSLYPGEHDGSSDSKHGKPSKLTLIALKVIIEHGGATIGRDGKLKIPSEASDAAANAVMKAIAEEGMQEKAKGLELSPINAPAVTPKSASAEEMKKLIGEKLMAEFKKYSGFQVADNQLGTLVATFSSGLDSKTPAPPVPAAPAPAAVPAMGGGEGGRKMYT